MLLLPAEIVLDLLPLLDSSRSDFSKALALVRVDEGGLGGEVVGVGAVARAKEVK